MEFSQLQGSMLLNDLRKRKRKEKKERLEAGTERTVSNEQRELS